MLIERYTRVVLSQPGAPFPLQRLAQLYRERDGNIAKLVKDFEQRAAQAGADQYAATVALAGIYKLDGRADDAIKTYEKAIALKPRRLRRRILALAHLLQDRGDVAGARTRYEQALAAAHGAGRQGADAPHADGARARREGLGGRQGGYHAQLVELEPTSLFVQGGARARALHARRVRRAPRPSSRTSSPRRRATTARSRRR